MTRLARCAAAALLLVGPLAGCDPLWGEERDDVFWLGVNYPWHHYGHDFGEAWTHDGVSTPESRAAVGADFAALVDDGIRLARWFIIADGRAGLQFDRDGQLVGLDPLVFDDLDAALAMAEEAGVTLLPVLFDFYWFDAAQLVNGVQTGGRSELVTDLSQRRALHDLVIGPIVERYAVHPRIIAWELINEPEWALEGDAAIAAEPIPLALMQAWVAELCDVIRARSSKPITLGSASLEEMQAYWVDSPLDILQFHHWGPEPLTVPYADLGVTRPVLIGEIPTRSPSLRLTTLLDAAWELGYLGALPWSFRAHGEQSDYPGARWELRVWAEAHAEQLLSDEGW